MHLKKKIFSNLPNNGINKKHSNGAPLIDIEKNVLDFFNKYSTLGLINDLPLNKYFFLADKILLKDYDYIGKSDLTTVIDKRKYFKLFFPTCNDNQIKELINEVTKLAETPTIEKIHII